MVPVLQALGPRRGQLGWVQRCWHRLCWHPSLGTMETFQGHTESPRCPGGSCGPELASPLPSRARPQGTDLLGLLPPQTTCRVQRVRQRSEMKAEALGGWRGARLWPAAPRPPTPLPPELLPASSGWDATRLQSCLETACFQNRFSQEKENSGVREEGKCLWWLHTELPLAAVAHGRGEGGEVRGLAAQ